MNSNIDFLSFKIESERDILQNLLKYYSPTSPIVLRCSEKLDRLLVQYENYFFTLKNSKVI